MPPIATAIALTGSQIAKHVAGVDGGVRAFQRAEADLVATAKPYPMLHGIGRGCGRRPASLWF